jgi:hypothetical protein
MHSDPQVQRKEPSFSNTSLFALLSALLPIALTIYLYRRSLRIFFLRDDFAWLGLRLSVFSPADLLSTLFAPLAQGTVRTLSERLFFLCFETLFGLEPLPMRIFALLTLAVAQFLLLLIVRRLSGSWLAGGLAALVFGLNFGVATAISWLSSYNQILLSALLLGAFYCFLRYSETLSQRWLWLTWTAYLLGYGALESNIVFPGIVLAYCLLFRRELWGRELWRRTLPFFVPAVLFALAHWKLIPKETRPEVYRMYFDASIFESLVIYWRMMLGSIKLIDLVPDAASLSQPSLWIVSLATLGSAAFASWRRDARPFFYLLFSLALIAPMLPLRDHRTDYYLASASLGFAMLLGSLPQMWGAWAGRLGYGLSFVVLLMYLYPSWLVQQSTINWYLETSYPVRTLLRGMEQATKLHPDKLILLSQLPEEVYLNSMDQDALRLVGANRARFAPGEGPPGSKFRIAPASAYVAFSKEAVIVYAFEKRQLKDVTRQWERGKALSLAAGLSPFISSDEPAFDDQFLAGWYPPENGRRWMGRSAELRLGGPFAPNAMLLIEAYCPDSVFDSAPQPLALEVLLPGQAARRFAVSKGSFSISTPLPPELRAVETLQVVLRSTHTVHPPGETRDLSFVFGSVGIR